MSKGPWKETREATIAIGCGFVAVVMGVSGVIVMTRQLVEDEDTYPYKSMHQQIPVSQTEIQSDNKYNSLIDNMEEIEETATSNNGG